MPLKGKNNDLSVKEKKLSFANPAGISNLKANPIKYCTILNRILGGKKILSIPSLFSIIV